MPILERRDVMSEPLLVRRELLHAEIPTKLDEPIRHCLSIGRKNCANLQLVGSPRDAPNILVQTSESIPTRRRIRFVEHIAH